MHQDEVTFSSLVHWLRQQKTAVGAIHAAIGLGSLARWAPQSDFPAHLRLRLAYCQVYTFGYMLDLLEVFFDSKVAVLFSRREVGEDRYKAMGSRQIA